ncbi:hypothetical protein J3458_005456 [Metarhizium acridum]|uniref:uncharacterized protein n=1 Tax=Metarhizium acridum TaxID=92637 RepID=UPI001C6B32D5|nr:hypothetical protein J3458_005456 [Metarhizium acridum]
MAWLFFITMLKLGILPLFTGLHATERLEYNKVRFRSGYGQYDGRVVSRSGWFQVANEATGGWRGRRRHQRRVEAETEASQSAGADADGGCGGSRMEWEGRGHSAGQMHWLN